VNKSRPSELTSGFVAPHDLDSIVVSIAGSYQASLPIAAARAGAVGLLDITYADDPERFLPELRRMVKLVEGRRFGLLIEGQLGASQRAAIESIGPCDLIVLSGDGNKVDREALLRCQQVAARVGVVVTSIEEAEEAVAAGADLLLAKGHEAGGVVGEQTTFILLQHLRAANCRLPIFAWGGIGFCTAAACRCATT